MSIPETPHVNGREPATAPPVDVPAALSLRRRILVITNDFPPRQGGIQSFVYSLLCQLPPDKVVVFASDYPGSRTFDADLPFPVVRHPTRMMLPTPLAARRALALRRDYGAEAVWFGAAAPLGLLAAALRRGGAERIVATTHGHEVGWARLPVARTALRRIAADVDVLTYLGAYTSRPIGAAVGARTELTQLTPGVDIDRFHPGIDAGAIRARHGLGDDPVVVCVSRLVPRKGQDTLIDIWPSVVNRHPKARLLVVGRGPYEQHLRAQAAGLGESVVFTGGVEEADLAAYVSAGDVFAMPCRTRRHGLDVEGLGIVYLEASACGRPVVAGNSGGAPDAVCEGVTGYVVADPAALRARLVELLDNSELRTRLGSAGRAWVEDRWQWSMIAARFVEIIDS
jgi:phosphatidylinositol alpha-1,6-mannosyltransferase